MDVLQELPVDKWPTLMKKVKDLWPLNVGGFYSLHLNLKKPAIREYFQFKVYGDADIGYIATNKRDLANSFILYSTSKDTSKLGDALLNTKLIDWKQQVAVMAPSIIVELLQTLKPHLGLNDFKLTETETFFLDKSSKPFEDVKCPPFTFMAELKQEHIKRVDSVWPHQYPGSEDKFSILAANGLSYGLFSLDNELLAWMFINEYNFLCHLYCEEKHRRKGYAEFILKYVANEKLAEGEDIYGFVVLGNEASRRLFVKLGFQHVDDSAWVYIGRH